MKIEQAVKKRVVSCDSPLLSHMPDLRGNLHRMLAYSGMILAITNSSLKEKRENKKVNKGGDE